MVVNLRGIKVFIATPGGLDAERQRFRDVLRASNEDDAQDRGVTFTPIGWELARAGMGRPQEKINEDVRKCDYLVLVLWDRWGSAPSLHGPYTSGTEEEYNGARDCVRDPEYPMRDIIVMFKGVDPKQLSDPGAQLSKVLEFKSRLEADKSLLFSTFDSLDEFERHLRKHLLVWTREEHEKQSDRGVNLPPSAASGDAPPEEASPGDVEALLESADRLADDGQLTKAESLYARAVFGRTDLGAITKYTRFLRRTGRLDQALAMTERLLELSRGLGDKTGEVEGLSNRAIIHRKRGNNSAAMEDLRTAITVAESRGAEGRGDVAFLYDNLGQTLRKAGDFPEAVRMHERALSPDLAVSARA